MIKWYQRMICVLILKVSTSILHFENLTNSPKLHQFSSRSSFGHQQHHWRTIFNQKSKHYEFINSPLIMISSNHRATHLQEDHRRPRIENINQIEMYINQAISSSLDFMLIKKLNYSFLFILIFFITINSISASSISRHEEMNHDFLCVNHAYDTHHCQMFAKDKWGNKKDERSLCCLEVEVKECILKKREEYCRGESMETFRKSHNIEMNHLKATKCKNYIQSSNCEEEFEIWTLAAMIMLCLISGMACITLGVLYTKK